MGVSILIDWISATDKTGRGVAKTFPPLLSGDDWAECGGKNGYTLGQKHLTGTRVYTNQKRPDMGNHIIYSGKTLDKIGVNMGMSSVDLIKYHIDSGHTIARLDLAIDFIGYSLWVDDFVQAFEKSEAKTLLRSATLLKSLTNEGETLYIGSMKKRKNLVRIYNKGIETGMSQDWVRVELQIMGKKATLAGREVAETRTIEESILSLIKGVIDFPTVPVWNMLMHDQLSAKMSLSSSKATSTETWLFNQVVPSLARVIVLNTEFWGQFVMALKEELPSGHDFDKNEKF